MELLCKEWGRWDGTRRLSGTALNESCGLLGFRDELFAIYKEEGKAKREGICGDARCVTK